MIQSGLSSWGDGESSPGRVFFGGGGVGYSINSCKRPAHRAANCKVCGGSAYRYCALTGSKFLQMRMPTYVNGHLPVWQSGDSDLRCSIQQRTRIWTIQREGRNLNIKPLTALTLHLVSPAHHSRCRVERRATCIFKALAGFEDWLLPNNTRPLDLSQFAPRIRNHPMAAQQLDRFPSLILDDDSICPEILRAVRRGLRFKVSRHNANRNASCACCVRGPICHKESLEQTCGMSQN